jgi:DNA repair protein RecN (Recombination protein N)
MLKSLLIKDYALIEAIQIEFGKGLNIITGETGAGKSIIIDAMGLLLGDRASSEVVRKGSEKSIVEGIFAIEKNSKLHKLLSANEIEFSDELIIRREISLKGTNRCFLNDTPVTLNVIKETGDLLVDLHGQHEHQSLLRIETHIDLLDDVANHQISLDDFEKEFGNLNSLIHNYKELIQKENLIQEKKELYEFQIKEIDQISPSIEEDEKLEANLKILENSEKLLSTSNEIYQLIYENEDAIQDKISDVKNKLIDLSKIDKTFTEKVHECDSVLAILNDISIFVREYKDRIDIEPEKIEETRIRLGAINLLKKKFGGSIKLIIEHREKIGKEFELAENFSVKKAMLQKEIEAARKNCGSLAKKISSNRKSISKKVKNEVELALKNLGIPDSNFEIRIVNEISDSSSENYIIVDNAKYKCDNKGYDFVEFFVTTNVGEDPKPLVKVASGGEVSRIMLALKSILAKSDRLPILIFDEIDTGISGRIAQKVGQSLKSLASFHQIIAITHLPQIAGVADFHYAVEKQKVGDRVSSAIRLLKEEERILEIAKLISGERISESAIISAKDLIKSL